MVEPLNKLYWDTQKPQMASMLQNSTLTDVEEIERNEIIGYLPNIKSKKVLELGAGIGRFTSHFAKHANHVTTLDFNKSFVEENKKRNSEFNNIKYIQNDVMSFKFKENQYDLIFINWLMMYLEDEDLLVLKKHLLNSLKPNGYLFFRESCFYEKKTKKNNYYANYRPINFYSNLFKNQFKLLKEGNIIFYVFFGRDMYQYFWLYQKT